MPQHFLKAAVLRAIRKIIAQVPLAEHGGAIAAIAHNLANGYLIIAQHRASHDGVQHASAIGPMPSDQSRPSRRTRRRHMVISKPHTLRMQLVEMRRLEHRIPVTRQVAVALVIRDDENDIRPLRRLGGKGEAQDDNN